MKPHSPPASAPASIITGDDHDGRRPRQAGSVPGTNRAGTPRTEQELALRPRCSRAASGTRASRPRPVRISGVALTSVSEMTPTLPKAAPQDVHVGADRVRLRRAR